MGLSTIDPYKKMTVSSECFDIEQLAIQQKLLRLQLEMIENELKQAEIFKSLQSSRQTILSCAVADTSDSDSLEAAIVTLSNCDFYHGSLSWQQSWKLLSKCSEGTFLIRKSQSQNPRFPFAISFQRDECEGGATSIRVSLNSGRWSLDCEDVLVSTMPSFSSITSLLQYYKDPANNCLVKLTDGLICDNHYYS